MRDVTFEEVRASLKEAWVFLKRFSKVALLGLTALYLFLLAAMHSIGYVEYQTIGKHYKSDSSWRKSIAMMVGHIGGRGGGGPLYSYCFDDGNYSRNSSWCPPFLDYIYGQKFEIMVNPKHRDRFFIIPWRPVFEKDDPTSIVAGTITRIGREEYEDKNDIFFLYDKKRLGDSLPDYYVFFTYSVAGAEYTRQQMLPPDRNERNKLIKSGQVFDVEYNIKYPKVAIIYPDRPVMNYSQ